MGVTAIPPVPDSSPRHALLLAKMARHSYVDWRLFEHDRFSVSVEDVLLPLMEADLVTITGETWGNTAEVGLTDAGRALAATASPEMLCGPQATGADRAGAALWLWLLINGATLGPYGSDAYGDHGEIAHLLGCGLDLAASSPVRDDAWEVWAGTFHEPERTVGVSGRATCSCGAVAQVSVHHEVASVTALVRQVLGG